MSWKPDLTRAVVILLLLYALSLLDRNLLSLMVRPIQADLAIGDVEIGLLQGFAFATFYVLCGIPLGMMADRYSRKWLIFGGVLCWSLATIACGLSRSFTELLFARFAVGVGEAALIPAAYSLLGDAAPKRHLAMAMAVFSTGAMFGAGLSVVLGGLLVQYLTTVGAMTIAGVTLAPWQLTFMVVGLLGLPLGMLAAFLPEPVRGSPDLANMRDHGFGSFLGANWRFFVPHFLGYGMIYVASAGGSGWSPTYLEQTWGWNMGQIGPALGFGVIACGLVGNIAAGMRIERQLRVGKMTAPLTYFAGGALYIAVVGALSPWAGSAEGFLLLHVSTCIFTVCAAAAGTALTLVTPPRFRGRIAALFTMVFNLLGTGTGPLAVGWFSQHLEGEAALAISLSLTYAISGILALILLVLAARAMPRMDEAGLTRTPG